MVCEAKVYFRTLKVKNGKLLDKLKQSCYFTVILHKIY
jgi:hypothetical protein